MLILIISDWIPDFHKLYNSLSSKIKLCQIIARPMATLKKKKKYRATRAHALKNIHTIWEELGKKKY